MVNSFHQSTFLRDVRLLLLLQTIIKSDGIFFKQYQTVSTTLLSRYKEYRGITIGYVQCSETQHCITILHIQTAIVLPHYHGTLLMLPKFYCSKTYFGRSYGQHGYFQQGKGTVHLMRCGEIMCYDSSTDLKTYLQIHETSQTHMN